MPNTNTNIIKSKANYTTLKNCLNIYNTMKKVIDFSKLFHYTEKKYIIYV